MAKTALQDDPTLEEIRVALAPLIARNAAFDGWRPAAVEAAAQQANVSPDAACLAFDAGPLTMIGAWFAHIDDAMLARCTSEMLAPLKIRERIAALVEARLELFAPDREALRRAWALLAMPQNIATATKLGWRAADHMWRAAGDKAADYNHYTKRALLATIYAATVIVFLDDESEGHADTSAFLRRRIDGVMRFEKTKARLAARAEKRPSMARFIGRLRYHAR